MLSSIKHIFIQISIYHVNLGVRFFFSGTLSSLRTIKKNVVSECVHVEIEPAQFHFGHAQFQIEQVQNKIEQALSTRSLFPSNGAISK